MTLKFRRNLPLVFLLVGILSLLALTVGDQQIVSYSVNMQALQVGDVRMAMAGLFGVAP